ncbi:glycosyltransferase family 4 protein [Candidatus Saccharibacteria bacterium]|nr:MAG: glycosyltransferase family 4 protein [Candidatus Saccharibacteria bacterium]
MKIVIDARELRTTTGRYIERLLHYLQEVDTVNTYSVLIKPEDAPGWTPSNSRFTKIVCPHKEFTLAEQVGLLHQIAQLHPDVVHFPMVQQPAFYRGTVVTTMNDLTTTRFRNPAKNALVFWLKQRVYVWLNKRVAKKSAALISYSEFVRDDVAAFAHVSPNKFTIIPLAADAIRENAEPLAALKNKRYIMYTGKPMPHKNLGRLIDAFVVLQKTYPELMLVLAGKKDANYARHEERVLREGIQNVIFTGFVSEGQLRWLYENCAAYVFPSLSEGFGLPGLEAMVHGAPVVSSNATCLPEVYGEAAHYFDPLDTSDMAAKIGEVLYDEALRSNLIKKGREQAATYSWRRTAEQTLEVYEKALGN